MCRRHRPLPIATLRAALEALQTDAFRQACSTANSNAAELGKDADSLTGLSREVLLKSALDLYDGTACPVCDTPFEPYVFQDHLARKLAHFDDVSKRRTALEAELKPVLDRLHAAGTALKIMIDCASLLSPKIDASELAKFRTVLRGQYEQLQKLFPIEDTRAVLAAIHIVPDLEPTMAALDATIVAIPEPTAALERIYKEVEAGFASYYQKVRMTKALSPQGSCPRSASSAST
ncbi:hypothetical protein [Bradyrhizobium sp. BR 1433]|uniref:hypothetical protein n=1 Tax=Bradyrhizobium sp. BR 1433 TaxID=3447967 RepID=UPI003EE46193